MTPDEFDSTPAERWTKHVRYELINGVLVVSPLPGNSEIDPNEYLGYLLRIHQEAHAEGSFLDVTLPEQTIPTAMNRRRCDRALWTGLGRIPDPEKDVPAIAVEFVSKSLRDRKRDYEQKRDEYLAAGVKEYWIIDRFRRIMIVCRKGTQGPVEKIVAETQVYETELLPGFILPLGRLLTRADLWNRPRPKRAKKPPAGGPDG